jgi:hypothetical protein
VNYLKVYLRVLAIRGECDDAWSTVFAALVKSGRREEAYNILDKIGEVSRGYTLIETGSSLVS